MFVLGLRWAWEIWIWIAALEQGLECDSPYLWQIFWSFKKFTSISFPTFFGGSCIFYGNPQNSGSLARLEDKSCFGSPSNKFVLSWHQYWLHSASGHLKQTDGSSRFSDSEESVLKVVVVPDWHISTFSAVFIFMIWASVPGKSFVQQMSAQWHMLGRLGRTL